MHVLTDLSLKQIAALALAASVALLAGAHAFENFGGLAPCILCLQQRDAHWVALAIAVGLLIAFYAAPRLPRQGVSILFVALTIAYLAGAGLAGYHMGVEWQWWEGPQACAAGNSGGFSVEDLANSLSQAPSGPSCDDVAWSLFGISMAGYNFLFSLALAGLGVLGLKKSLAQT